ncbi:MAG: cytochrome c oxidase subunit 3 [Acidobacteriota bacterium]
MAHANEGILAGWSGGAFPYAISSKKLGMWLFIISDTFTFAALLIAYSYVRFSTPNWPTPFNAGSIGFASIMTFFLLSSSLTMVMAVQAAERKDTLWTVLWIMATMLGGLAFVVLHSIEWRGLIMHEHVKLFKNEWGVPLFGATFFGITGLHMMHVISGVIYLGVVASNVVRKRATHDDVEIVGLYWHFVDLVWMFVFPMIYLLSVNLSAKH